MKKRQFSVRNIEAAIKRNRAGGREFFRGATVSEVRGEKMEIGSVKTFVMSEEIRDRHGTLIVLQGGNIDQYNLNPVFLWMHESARDWYDTQPYDDTCVIGKGKAYFGEDGKLRNDVVFEDRSYNERAWRLENKIQFGSLRAVSIGFIPLKGHWGVEDDGEDTGTYYITEWILLELSLVVIPSNYKALLEEKEHDGRQKDDDDQEGDDDQADDNKSGRLKSKNIGATAVARARLSLHN